MSVVEQYRLNGDTANEISASIERAISEGRIAAGGKLPTVRALAADLRVSPATVAAAYRRLRERGIATGSGRRGTTVNARPPLPSRAAPTVPAGVRNLAEGTPDPAMYPDWAPVLRRLVPEHRSYGNPTVLPELTDAARTQLTADRIPAASVTVVGGALDGVERVLMAWLRPGDAVAVEDPGYPNLLDLVAVLGLRALPVALDDEGMLPESLQQALDRGARAAIVTPRAQNPTGAALTRCRVRQLRELLAGAPEVLLVEDDHAAGIAGAPYHCLAAGNRHWAVLRSMAKVFGPDLRLAVLAGDRQTVGRVSGRYRLGPQWVSRLLQQLAAALMADASVQAHVDAAAVEIARRREALLSALAGRGIPARGGSGLNVWIPVPDEAVAQVLGPAGWGVAAGSRFRLQSPPAIRVTAARLPVTAAADFAAALEQCLTGTDYANYTG